MAPSEPEVLVYVLFKECVVSQYILSLRTLADGTRDLNCDYSHSFCDITNAHDDCIRGCPPGPL